MCAMANADGGSRMGVAAVVSRRRVVKRLAASLGLALAVVGLASASAEALELRVSPAGEGGQYATWNSLKSQGFLTEAGNPEWGYRITVSNGPREDTGRRQYLPPAQPLYPGGAQYYAPPAELQAHLPISNDKVWVGVLPVSNGSGSDDEITWNPGAKDQWSETEAEVTVTGLIENRPPSGLTLSADEYTLSWESVAKATGGYAVAISRIERNGEPEGAEAEQYKKERDTKFLYAPGPSFTLTYEEVQKLVGEGFFPKGGHVYVGVGTHMLPGETPGKYSAEEKRLKVPVLSTNKSPPTITGSAIRGQQLTALHGEWEPEPASYSYQWQLCDSEGNGCSAITGATAETILLTSEDLGHKLRVVVTAHNSTGEVAAVSGTSPVIGSPPPPVNTAAPEVSGRAIRDDILTTSTGSWEGSPSLSYQWQLCDSSGNGCSDIPSATSATIVLTSATVGRQLRALVTAQNAGGTVPVPSDTSGVIGSRVETELPLALAHSTLGWLVQSMVITGAPSGAVVEVACHGGSCPFKLKTLAHSSAHLACQRGCIASRSFVASAQRMELTSLFKHRHLKAGTVIVVRVLRSGWVGKRFTIVLGRHLHHSKAATCLVPGSATATQPCSQ
jgi:hypothetical protein